MVLPAEHLGPDGRDPPFDLKLSLAPLDAHVPGAGQKQVDIGPRLRVREPRLANVAGLPDRPGRLIPAKQAGMLLHGSVEEPADLVAGQGNGHWELGARTARPVATPCTAFPSLTTGTPLTRTWRMPAGG